MPVTQSAAKITPRTYIAGTTAPEAMTSACSTVPAHSTQPMRGRPTTPPISRAQTARPPPIPPASPRFACSRTMATGMASPMTIASMISTVPHNCLIRLAPS